MKRYAKRYYVPVGWNFKGNHLVGTQWTVPSSKPGSEYVVTMVDNGFGCSCTGFNFHGKCKHVIEIVERFD
jgi:hypothetical protein